MADNMCPLCKRVAKIDRPMRRLYSEKPKELNHLVWNWDPSNNKNYICDTCGFIVTVKIKKRK